MSGRFGSLFVGAFVFVILAVGVSGSTHSFSFVHRAEYRHSDGFSKLSYTVNGQLPGPTIDVQLGDTVQVQVENQLASQSTSMHWHGVRQGNTTFQDGMPFVSQYPIAPGGSFSYTFVAQDAGTYWYHSHTGTQRSDGAFGLIIVRDPNDPVASSITGNYTSIILQEWTHLHHEQVSGALADGSMLPLLRPPYRATLFNGQGRFNCSSVHNSDIEADVGSAQHDCINNYPLYELQLDPFVAGSRTVPATHRLRVLNASPSLTLIFSIDKHHLLVVAVDGKSVLPYNAQRVTVYAAQRYEFLLSTSQPAGAYFMRTQTAADVDGTDDAHEAGLSILRYTTAPGGSYPVSDPWLNGYSTTLVNWTPDLFSGRAIPPPLRADYILTITLWCSEITWQCYMNGNMFQPPVKPASLATFLRDPLPATFVANASSAYTWTRPPSPAEFTPTSGPNIIDIPLGATVEIIFNNINTNQAHPIHVHGHNFFSLGVGKNNAGLFDPAKFELNRVNPVLRDTQQVNQASWMVWSLTADNPGVWPLHCHFEPHLAAGMMMLLRVGPEQVHTNGGWAPPSNLPVMTSFTRAYERIPVVCSRDPSIVSGCSKELANISVTAAHPTFFTYAFVAWAQFDIVSRMPPFIVTPGSVADVQRTLRCASEQCMRVAIKGGGHSYAGFSQVQAGDCNAFGMSLRFKMSQVRLVNYTLPDSRVVSALFIEAGATFQTVYNYLRDQNLEDAFNLIIPGGLCPSVGVTAFFTGGGIGALSRLHGMGVDSVLEVTMVPVNGSDAVVANAVNNTDLFWAIRGGGQSNLGVITSLVIRLHGGANKNYTLAAYCVPDTEGLPSMRTALQSLGAYVTPSVDFVHEIAVHWRVRRAAEGETILPSGLCFLVYSTLPLLETVDKVSTALHLNPDLERWNFKQEFGTFLEMELANAQLKGYSDLFQTPKHTRNCVIPPLTDAVIDGILALHQRALEFDTPGLCYIQGLALGGQVNHVNSNATAFPFRTNFDAYISDSECDFTTDKENAWTLQFVRDWKALLVNSSACRGTYLNFPYEEKAIPYDFAKSYWGDNLPRLQSIKEAWNPVSNNPLWFPHQVPSTSTLPGCIAPVPPPSAPSDDDSKHSGLSGADIAGIVIGIAMFIAIIALGSYKCWKIMSNAANRQLNLDAHGASNNNLAAPSSSDYQMSDHS